MHNYFFYSGLWPPGLHDVTAQCIFLSNLLRKLFWPFEHLSQHIQKPAVNCWSMYCVIYYLYLAQWYHTKYYTWTPSLFPLPALDQVRKGKEPPPVTEGREQEKAGVSQWEFKKHDSNKQLNQNIKLCRQPQLLSSPGPPLFFFLLLHRVYFILFSQLCNLLIPALSHKVHLLLLHYAEYKPPPIHSFA